MSCYLELAIKQNLLKDQHFITKWKITNEHQ
jgi:hypothetical protein